jgi:hypothetical protein
MPINVDINLMRIIASAAEEFSAVLHATPDVPFSIDASTKFTTNMDQHTTLSSEFSKNQLTYTMACQSPTIDTDATDKTKAADCCATLFSFTSPILTKNK